MGIECGQSSTPNHLANIPSIVLAVSNVALWTLSQQDLQQVVPRCFDAKTTSATLLDCRSKGSSKLVAPNFKPDLAQWPGHFGSGKGRSSKCDVPETWPKRLGKYPRLSSCNYMGGIPQKWLGAFLAPPKNIKKDHDKPTHRLLTKSEISTRVLGVRGSGLGRPRASKSRRKYLPSPPERIREMRGMCSWDMKG